MRSAGPILMLSAAFYLLGAILTGFAVNTQALLIVAVLYAALFAGLSRGMLWVAWLAFVVVLIGTAWALSGVLGSSPLPDWLLWAVLGTNAVAAVLLFGAIWSVSDRETP